MAHSDILTRIDAALGCQQCLGQLGVSPSDDFCSQACQEAWHTARADTDGFDRHALDADTLLWWEAEVANRRVVGDQGPPSPADVAQLIRADVDRQIQEAMSDLPPERLRRAEWLMVRTLARMLRPHIELHEEAWEGCRPTYTIVDETHHWTAAPPPPL